MVSYVSFAIPVMSYLFPYSSLGLQIYEGGSVGSNVNADTPYNNAVVTNNGVPMVSILNQKH